MNEHLGSNKTCKYFKVYIVLPLFLAPAINVTNLMVTIPLIADGAIPLRIELLDDEIAEPLEFYELTLELDDTSDTSIKLGSTDTTFIIVEDDDGKENVMHILLLISNL